MSTAIEADQCSFQSYLKPHTEGRLADSRSMLDLSLWMSTALVAGLASMFQ